MCDDAAKELAALADAGLGQWMLDSQAGQPDQLESKFSLLCINDGDERVPANSNLANARARLISLSGWICCKWSNSVHIVSFAFANFVLLLSRSNLNQSSQLEKTWPVFICCCCAVAV